MAEPLRKFFMRSPRYVLRPGDNEILYFTTEGQSNIHKQPTKILNMSASGVAFLVPRESAPKIGDKLKVEFQVPDLGPVAWWAKVVRLEEFTSEGWYGFHDPEFREGKKLFAAVHFEDLPDDYFTWIKKGLDAQFLKVAKQNRKENWKNLVDFLGENTRQVMIWGFCLLSLVGLFYFWSQITLDYYSWFGPYWEKFVERLSF